MQVTISKDDTVILDGAGDKKAIEERAEQVHSISLASKRQFGLLGAYHKILFFPTAEICD
jgi:hypothetical protein